MGNPLLVLAMRPRRRRAEPRLRRVSVEVPADVPTSDAIFLVLRRLRAPLIVLIVTFSVSVFGLTLIPGQDADGNTVYMTGFDAFYVMSYTATTIGFGEIPHPFTALQRLWVTGSIYATVIGWAYAIATAFALLQDENLRLALTVGRFRRGVRRIREPFYVMAGYGQAGRLVGRQLDRASRRFTVVETDRGKVEALAGHDLANEVPGYDGDARNPAVLGLAGLGQPHCAGILALTDDDETNLAIVMTAHLLRPDLPLIARCGDRAVAARMAEFEPHAVINPFDRYGTYLVMAVRRPVAWQLVTWLMNPPGSELPELVEGLGDGRWVVCADDRFGREVVHDLREAGLTDVVLLDPSQSAPDLGEAVGMVAGTDEDTRNLSLAAHARLTNPQVFLSVRQRSHVNAPLLEAFGPDSVFVPTDLVAREALARLMTPMLWGFIEHVTHEDEQWAAEVVERLVARCGTRTPHAWLVTIDTAGAPALATWLRRTGAEFRLADLLRDPDGRDEQVSAVPLLLRRGEDQRYLPGEEEPVRVGDEVLLLGRRGALDAVHDTVFGDALVEYVATGRQVPETWLWRRLSSRRRRAGDVQHGATDTP